MVVIPALRMRAKATLASGPSICGAEIIAIVNGCDAADAAAAAIATAAATAAARTAQMSVRQRRMIDRKTDIPGRATNYRTKTTYARGGQGGTDACVRVVEMKSSSFMPPEASGRRPRPFMALKIG